MMPSARLDTVNQGARVWELQPDQPITPIRSHAFRRFAVRTALLAVLAAAGWWAAAGDGYGWRDWAVSEASTFIGQLQNQGARHAAGPGTSKPTEPTTASSGSELPEENALSTPSVLNGPAEGPQQANERAAATAPSVGTAYVAPSREPDALERRATAAGLHSDISRAVLLTLSDADFTNAGVAINKALAETPDDGALVWPRQRKPELALFRVHFVAGAAPECRRYVVTITKDNWMTTALPMERCGLTPAGPRRG